MFRPNRLSFSVLLPAAAMVVTAGALSAPRPAEAPDPPLLAGYAEAEITPPLGGSMPGYFRDRQATGVLDPLKAKALYLRRGRESVALVACDLIGMGAPLVRRIREATVEAARTRGVPAPGTVWVHCTHTHTGGMVPRTGSFTSDAERIYPGFYPGRVDPAWVERLVTRTAEAVTAAAASAEAENRPTLHEGREASVAFIRRYLMKDGRVRTNPGRLNPEIVRPVGEIDPRVHVLRFERSRILAVFYGCHPDCIGGTLYSADYPAYLTEGIRERLGAEWRVIFFNTCSGNINHIDVTSATQRSGPDEARRIGRKLAEAAVAALGRGAPLTVDALAARSATVRCRLRRPAEADVQEAEERLRTGRAIQEFNGLFAPAAVVLARTRDREHRAEIAALRLGSFGLAAMPGEVFVELGREVEAGSPFRPTRTLGLTNGAMGYIPTREAFAQGGYETGYRSARYEPETGHRWAAAAVELLRSLARGD